MVRWFREFLRSRRCSRAGLREGAAGVSRKSLDNVCSGTWNEENKHDPHRASGLRAEPVLLPGEGKRGQTEGPARSRSPGRPRRSRRHRDGARGGPGPSAGVFGLPRAGTAGTAPPRAPQGLGKRLNPGEAGGGSRLTRPRPPTAPAQNRRGRDGQPGTEPQPPGRARGRGGKGKGGVGPSPEPRSRALPARQPISAQSPT